jgi:hypothetical protein
VRDPPLRLLAPTNTTTPGAPFSPRDAEAPRGGRGSAEPSPGAVLGVLAPLDGSGCTSRHSLPAPPAFADLRGPPEVVTPRRFAALFHAARVPGVALQSFCPLEEPYPLSRAVCFLAGSRSTAAWRDVLEAFTTAFRVPPTPCLSLPLRTCRTPGPGRRFLATAEAIRRAYLAARRPRPSISLTPGPPVGGRHAHFEALLPP